jgi:long-chain acyl-CoA synthetase
MSMIEHYLSTWEQMISPDGQFAMDEIEVRGNPMRVFRNAPPTMRSLWELTAGYADRDYLVYEDERLTYAETAAQVRALAHLLVNEHGVGRGDRVAIAMRNYSEWVVSYWAIVSIGAAAVGMNARFTPEGSDR